MDASLYLGDVPDLGSMACALDDPSHGFSRRGGVHGFHASRIFDVLIASGLAGEALRFDGLLMERMANDVDGVYGGVWATTP